jgi:hypothetical protein
MAGRVPLGTRGHAAVADAEMLAAAVAATAVDVMAGDAVVEDVLVDTFGQCPSVCLVFAQGGTTPVHL